jgi:cysteine-rich repeat protein
VCSTCGNGQIEENEACDDGEANGNGGPCQADCTLAPAANVAGIVAGSTVAAVAGSLFVVALVGALYKLAKYKGLFTKASTTVDFGSAHTNPIFNEPDTVKTNPCYSYDPTDNQPFLADQV